MAVFNSQINSAKKLIDKNGGPCVVVLDVPGAPATNPWDTATPDTQVTADCRGVFLSFSTNSYGTTFAGGDVIQANDRKVLIAAKGLTVVPNLKGMLKRQLLDGSIENWTIAGIRSLDPNGEQIMYTLQVRR
jgi:hypothetical protein